MVFFFKRILDRTQCDCLGSVSRPCRALGEQVARGKMDAILRRSAYPALKNSAPKRLQKVCTCKLFYNHMVKIYVLVGSLLLFHLPRIDGMRWKINLAAHGALFYILGNPLIALYSEILALF